MVSVIWTLLEHDIWICFVYNHNAQVIISDDFWESKMSEANFPEVQINWTFSPLIYSLPVQM